MTDKLRQAAEMALHTIERLMNGEPRSLHQGDQVKQILRQALNQLPDTTEMIEQISMSASELADRIKRGEKWKIAEPDTGIDRGAWSDVPDATKWVDELRGDDDLEGSPNFTTDVVERKWVGLTDEEIEHIWGITKPDYEDKFDFSRAIEAALKSKNGF